VDVRRFLRHSSSDRGAAVRATLGPYETGQYAFILEDGVERFDVRRQDGYRNGSPRLSLRVRYESPEGWVTYSPELKLDLADAQDMRWERRG